MNGTLFWLTVILCCAATSVFAQPQDTGSAGGSPPLATERPAVGTATAVFGTRLAELTPNQPWKYLELGEEVAETAADPADRALARTIFVLAYETSKKAAAGSGASPVEAGADIRISVCLALASIAPTDAEQRWLRAIASSLGWDGPGTLASSPAGSSASIDPAALELASAIGLIRIAEGRRAARIFEKPEVAKLLDQTERLLSPAGLTGGSQRLRRLMAEWPICSECKNRRFIKAQQGVRLCPTCGGKPGPKLPQQELMYQLRLESSLLHGVQRSWVAQTVVDGGAPLRDLDPDELAATYLVDPKKTVWRNGAWAAPSRVESPKQAPTPVKPGPPENGR